MIWLDVLEAAVAEWMAVELAEYIERGLESAKGLMAAGFRVLETPLALFELRGNVYHAGALGLALIGKWGGPETALEQWLQVCNTSPAGKFDAAAALLGVSVALVRLVEINHRNCAPAAEIARKLRLGTLGLVLRNQRKEWQLDRAVLQGLKAGLSAGSRSGTCATRPLARLATLL